MDLGVYDRLDVWDSFLRYGAQDAWHGLKLNRSHGVAIHPRYGAHGRWPKRGHTFAYALSASKGNVSVLVNFLASGLHSCIKELSGMGQNRLHFVGFRRDIWRKTRHSQVHLGLFLRG